MCALLTFDDENSLWEQLEYCFVVYFMNLFEAFQNLVKYSTKAYEFTKVPFLYS